MCETFWTLPKDEKAHGMVYSLNHDEIYSLYHGAGLTDYAAEAVMVDVENNTIPALCCNLIIPPEESESNPEYEGKLKSAMELLGIPWSQA